MDFSALLSEHGLAVVIIGCLFFALISLKENWGFRGSRTSRGGPRDGSEGLPEASSGVIGSSWGPRSLPEPAFWGS